MQTITPPDGSYRQEDTTWTIAIKKKMEECTKQEEMRPIAM